MLSTDLQESAPAAESLHVVQSCWPDATLTSCNKLCEQCNPAPTIKQAWSLFLPSHTLHPSPPVRSVTLTHFSTGRLNFRMQLFHHAVFFFFYYHRPRNNRLNVSSPVGTEKNWSMNLRNLVISSEPFESPPPHVTMRREARRRRRRCSCLTVGRLNMK